jgi:hypothetical protein
LHETYGLAGKFLQAWYRERGPFAHHPTSWKVAFCAKGKEPTSSRRELHTAKDEIVMLKCAVVRKGKALAKAAVLLIL